MLQKNEQKDTCRCYEATNILCMSKHALNSSLQLMYKMKTFLRALCVEQ